MKKEKKLSKNFDPKISLIGGDDGLKCYRDIANSMSSYMTDHGLAFFEIGYGQKKDIIKIFALSGFSLCNVWKDLKGLERVICVKKDA